VPEAARPIRAKHKAFASPFPCRNCAFSTVRATQTSSIRNIQSRLLNTRRTKGTNDGPDFSSELPLQLPSPKKPLLRLCKTEQQSKAENSTGANERRGERRLGCLIESCQPGSAIVLSPVPFKPLPSSSASERARSGGLRQPYQPYSITRGEPRYPAEQSPPPHEGKPGGSAKHSRCRVSPLPPHPQFGITP